MRKAQDRMKYFVGKNRLDRCFEVSDWVYLKLKPYRQSFLHSAKVWKLSPKYAGPFQVQAKVGSATYQLFLQPQAKIHLVFHVSLLKRKVGLVTVISPTLPNFDDDGKVVLQPVKIFARRLVKKGSSLATQLLV